MCKIFRQSRSKGLGSKLDSSSLTCSSFTCSLEVDLREVSKISGGWTKKSIRGSGSTIERVCDSSKKSSKTEEVDREGRK